MNEMEKDMALQTLERYSGSKPDDFQENIIITNFPTYVQYFADARKIEIFEGSAFQVAHSREEKVSILDFKIGSPAAALVIDICSFLPNTKTAIFLGMCGGLRRRYRVGEYLVPVAAIRGEGTSDYYFPQEVPALANFLMQRAVTEVLEDQGSTYHIGITFTTNMRFWEFNEEFKNNLKASKAQGIEMECATLFTASYKRKFTLGVLLLISDLPLNQSGIKTKKSAEYVLENFTKDHVEKGIFILKRARELQKKYTKGSYKRNVQ
jgi:AMP nucleosidase